MDKFGTQQTLLVLKTYAAKLLVLLNVLGETLLRKACIQASCKQAKGTSLCGLFSPQNAPRRPAAKFLKTQASFFVHLPHRRSPSLPSHAAPHSCHSTEETQRQAEGYCCFPAGHRGLEATGHPFWARSPTTGFRSPALENSKTTRPGLHRKGYGVLPFYIKRGAISSPLKSERVVGGF